MNISQYNFRRRTSTQHTRLVLDIFSSCSTIGIRTSIGHTSGCANLCLRLRKPSSKVAQVSAAHKPQKPSPQVAQTFASGCANLCLRLRKPLPQVAQTFACVSLLDALLDSEHCVVSQLSCGFRCVVSTHLSLLRSRHPDK